MPVGKLSAVEHSGLTGACPTYSAWTPGKSRINVETPRASFARLWQARRPTILGYHAGMFRLAPLLIFAAALHAQDAPLRLAIAGLAHGHVSGFLRSAKPRADVKIVAVFDSDPALTASYAKSNGFAPEMMFNDLAVMLDRVKPEAVATFTSTFDHAAIVEACARRHIPVMMEKPLAVSVQQARAIQKAAAASNIPVMVNYETTWYKSHGEIWKLIKEQKAGSDIRKM